MDKKTKLILAQSLLLLFIIVTFGNIIIYKKGNIFLRSSIKQKITDFYQENYESENLLSTDLIYHFKSKSYSITYYDKNVEEHSFDIIYKNNKLESTYQKDYIEGASLLKQRSKIIEKNWQDTFADTPYQDCKISFFSLNQYAKNQQEQILKKKNLKSSYLYQVTCSMETNDINEEVLNQQINTLDMIATANQFYPQKYTFIFNDGDIIKEIVKEKGDKTNE